MNGFWTFLKNLFGGKFKITSDGSLRDGEKSTPFPAGVSSTTDFVNGLTSGNSGFPSIFGALTNWLNSMSGEHMVNADVERNAMQMQNVEDIYQRQVTGMQKAGLNPALMYQNGVGSAPQAPSASSPGASMSDIMQALLLDKQSKYLDSQIRNKDADTNKKQNETERLKLLNKYYPSVTDAQIKEVMSRIGLNDEKVKEIDANVDLLQVEKRLKEIDEVIKNAEANESSAFFKARRELEEAKTDEAKASKREKLARAFMEEIEGQFMNDKGFKMGSSEILAISSAIASLFGIDKTHGVGNEAFNAWFDSFSKPGGLLQQWFEELMEKKGYSNSR